MAEAYKERLQGEGNPNYGNRHPGIWEMPAEMRAKLSRQRSGEGNPNWVAGDCIGDKFSYRHHVWRWAESNLELYCRECGESQVDLHHIVPRRLFEPPAASNFVANLVPLCRSCHATADHRVRAVENSKPRQIPFASHLPEPILQQLKKDGLVSRLPQSVDLSPLGNVASEVVSSEQIGIPE
jgi:hypothetical protein